MPKRAAKRHVDGQGKNRFGKELINVQRKTLMCLEAVLLYFAEQCAEWMKKNDHWTPELQSYIIAKRELKKKIKELEQWSKDHPPTSSGHVENTSDTLKPQSEPELKQTGLSKSTESDRT